MAAPVRLGNVSVLTHSPHGDPECNSGSALCYQRLMLYVPTPLIRPFWPLLPSAKYLCYQLLSFQLSSRQRLSSWKNVGGRGVPQDRYPAGPAMAGVTFLGRSVQYWVMFTERVRRGLLNGGLTMPNDARDTQGPRGVQRRYSF